VNVGFQVAGDLSLPDDLTELDQWVLWRQEHGKKVPYSVSGRKASSTDPRTWSTYETAFAGLRANPTLFSGIGIVFTERDPLVGIDLDDCLDASREVKPWARTVIERFCDTYCEVSPSRLGLKIWARGSLPANVPTVAVGDGGIELYGGHRRADQRGGVLGPGSRSWELPLIEEAGDGARLLSNQAWGLRALFSAKHHALRQNLEKDAYA